MGFSVLVQSGICFGAEHFSVTGSSLFGQELRYRKSSLRHPPHIYAPCIASKIIRAAVRNEFSGGEKREEEKNKLLGVASASIGLNAVLLMSVTKPALPVHRHKDFPSSWLSLPLLAVWGAILLNAFVQYRVLERLTSLPQRRESTNTERVDHSLKQRVAELEENVREFVTTARGLSKQVEKLGVRFRATKRTLRDPSQETAAISQKASEVTTALAQREDRLEAELRGLQRALLAMQEHQVKQLSLISLALKRTQSEGQALDLRRTKKFQSSVNGSGSVLTPSRGFKAVEPAQAVEKPKKAVERTSNGASQRGDSAPHGTFSSEESLSKIDFWKEEVKSHAVLPHSEKMPVSSSAAFDRDGGSGKSNLGNFFSGRKKSPVSVPNPPLESTVKPKTLNADTHKSESGILPETEDPSNYLYEAQPDYDSDSWLR